LLSENPEKNKRDRILSAAAGLDWPRSLWCFFCFELVYKYKLNRGKARQGGSARRPALPMGHTIFHDKQIRGQVKLFAGHDEEKEELMKFYLSGNPPDHCTDGMQLQGPMLYNLQRPHTPQKEPPKLEFRVYMTNYRGFADFETMTES